MIEGKSMVQRVYEQAAKCTMLDAVVVATDDERIFQHVKAFGDVAMTATTNATGTDRCAEVAALPAFSGHELVVNIQGDEPFIRPEQIALAVSVLQKNEQAQVGTLVKRIDKAEDLFNPNVVKAVFGENGLALYFSRSPIPHLRHLPQAEWLSEHIFYKHIGLYVFRRETLMRLTRLPQGNLERAESLEQLRWLEHGVPIGVAITEFETVGIDTPEDLCRDW